MLVPLNSSDQTIFQLPAGPFGCTDAGGVTCGDVGPGVGPGELPPTDGVLGVGELLLPDDDAVDGLGLTWYWHQCPWPTQCQNDRVDSDD